MNFYSLINFALSFCHFTFYVTDTEITSNEREIHYVYFKGIYTLNILSNYCFFKIDLKLVKMHFYSFCFIKIYFKMNSCQ